MAKTTYGQVLERSRGAEAANAAKRTRPKRSAPVAVEFKPRPRRRVSVGDTVRFCLGGPDSKVVAVEDGMIRDSEGHTSSAANFFGIDEHGEVLAETLEADWHLEN